MVTEIKIKQKADAPKEKVVQKKIMEYLKSEGFSADVITSSLYGKSGISDIIACYNGKYFAIEVKRFPGMSPSKLQEAWLKEKHQHGAFTICVGSLYEMKEFVKELRRARLI